MSKVIQFDTGRRAQLLPALKREQGTKGQLSKPVMNGVTDLLNVPLNEAYSVATFYAFLSVVPVGKNIVRVCRCLPCELKDGLAIIASIEKHLGVAPGQVTTDGKFSFELVGCIGACDQAPAMLINDKLYGNLTPERITEILSTY
jgi:NADH-quinone oxidoreductase subunit E